MGTKFSPEEMAAGTELAEALGGHDLQKALAGLPDRAVLDLEAWLLLEKARRATQAELERAGQQGMFGGGGPMMGAPQLRPELRPVAAHVRVTEHGPVLVGTHEGIRYLAPEPAPGEPVTVREADPPAPTFAIPPFPVELSPEPPVLTESLPEPQPAPVPVTLAPEAVVPLDMPVEPPPGRRARGGNPGSRLGGRDDAAVEAD
jgi:hypothetical protein